VLTGSLARAFIMGRHPNPSLVQALSLQQRLDQSPKVMR
jgi:hypothetical protein